LVDLSAGTTTPLVHTFDEWYDARAKVRRVRDVVAGVPIADVRLRAGDEMGFASVVLAEFPRLYRTGLARTPTARVTEGRVSGESVYWIAFRKSPLVRVAVDQATFRPVRVIFRGNDGERRFSITHFSVLEPNSRVPAASSVKPRRMHPARVLPSRPAAAADSTAFQVFGEGLSSLRGHLLKLLDVAARPAYDILFTKGAPRRTGSFLEVQESAAPTSEFGWTTERAHLVSTNKALIERSGSLVYLYGRSAERWYRIVGPSRRSTMRALQLLRAS
jgi:hypothetical protein